ncbi:MAG: sulfite exporter TauE/SafE family protein [Thermoproteota archaeon]
MSLIIGVSLMLIALFSTTLLSTVGLAGGTFIAPLLILLFGLESRYAAGTSIFAIFFGIFSAAYTYFRQGRVDFKLAILFDTLDVVGVFIGTYLVVVLPSSLTAFLLGLFLIMIASRLWFREEKQKAFEKPRRHTLKRILVDKDGKLYQYELGIPEIMLSQAASLFSGIATGLFGVGGGTVDTTIMMLIGVPPHVAVATAVFGMTITKISGVLTHLVSGNILLYYGIPLAIGATIGGQLGPRLSRRARPILLKRILSIIVLLIGLRMLVPL